MAGLVPLVCTSKCPMIDENASDEDREGSCDSESENDRIDCCDNRLDDNLEKESKDDLEDGVISVFSEDTIDLKQDIQTDFIRARKKVQQYNPLTHSKLNPEKSESPLSLVSALYDSSN